MKAEFPGASTPSQNTAYVYGIGGTNGTNLFSNDVIKQIDYPDPSSGAPSTSLSGQVSYTYDLLGEKMSMTDRNQTTHSYNLDILGRTTADVVTTLGSGVDGSIRRLGYTFNALGLPYQQTSYSDTGGTSIVNQIEDLYNGLGQLTNQYQAASGAVNISTTPQVQYVYNLMAGGQNNSRLRAMIYPNGRILDYADSPNQEPVTSLTYSGTTATATTAAADGLSSGDTVVIEGAGAPFDGTFTVASIIDSTHFTYTMASTPSGATSGTNITAAKLSLDTTIGRVDGEQDHGGSAAGTVLEGYSYLGLNTIGDSIGVNS